MEIEERSCRICGEIIPPARVAAMPETLVCVRCSRKIGGEYELKVTISSTGKAGSLKKTGQDISVERKAKAFK